MKPAAALKLTLLFIALGGITGCKLAVIATEGGDIALTSINGADSGTCQSASICSFDIDSPTFGIEVTAVPRPGYRFQKWQGGDGFICGDSTETTCTWALPGGDFGSNAISFYESLYLMPLYKDVGVDTDGDGIVDRKDDDDDNDGVLDTDDNCPLLGPNEDGFGCPL